MTLQAVDGIVARIMSSQASNPEEASYSSAGGGSAKTNNKSSSSIMSSKNEVASVAQVSARYVVLKSMPFL